MVPIAASRSPPGVRPQAPGVWRSLSAPHVQGFVVRPWCWIVERTLGWMGRQRRLSKDYERKVQTSETLLTARDDPAHGAAFGEEPHMIFKTRSYRRLTRRHLHLRASVGSVRICHHGLPATHNPRPPELPAQSGIATWCYPLEQSDWYWEPLDSWRDFARRARAVLNLAAAMGQEIRTRREDSAVLHDTWAQKWDASGGNIPVAVMRLVLKHVVNTWLVWGHFARC